MISFIFLLSDVFFLYFQLARSAANGRPALNLETGLDHDGHPLAITAGDTVVANGVTPWNWRETPENGKSIRFNRQL